MESIIEQTEIMESAESAESVKVSRDVKYQHPKADLTEPQERLIRTAFINRDIAKTVLELGRGVWDTQYLYILSAMGDAAAAGALLTRKAFQDWLFREHPQQNKPSIIASELAIYNRCQMKSVVKTDDVWSIIETVKEYAVIRDKENAVNKIRAGDIETGVTELKAAGVDTTEIERMAAGRRLDGRSYTATDVGNAEMFADAFRDDMRYVSDWKRWIIWDGKRWAVDNRQAAMVKAMELVRYIMPSYAQSIKDDDSRAKYLKHIASSQNRGRIENMLVLAGANLSVATNELDANPILFNCQNGTMDTRTGELKPHNRADMLTKISPCHYKAAATCPQWDRFLNRIFEKHLELMPFIQRAIGYSLTGSVQEQCLFVLWGGGANGKSTFLNTILHVLGDYGQQAQPSLLMGNGGGRVGNGEDVAGLFGVRFVSSIETREGKSFDEERVKALTGGDRIRARRLYENSWEFEPTHKIFLATNHKPRISGTDYGIWRRLNLVPFEATIAESEKDAALYDKLKSEADGIFRWAVDGLKAWRAGGLKAPSIVKDKVDEYRAESDVFGQFLQSECVMDDGASVKASQLYAVYQAWAKDNGIDYTMTAITLGKKLKERGLIDGRKSGSRCWLGIGLLAEMQDKTVLAYEDKAF